MIVIRPDESGCGFTAAAVLAGLTARFCGKLAPAPCAFELGFDPGACAGMVNCACNFGAGAAGTAAATGTASAVGSVASVLAKGAGASSPTESTVFR